MLSKAFLALSLSFSFFSYAEDLVIKPADGEVKMDSHFISSIAWMHKYSTKVVYKTKKPINPEEDVYGAGWTYFGVEADLKNRKQVFNFCSETNLKIIGSDEVLIQTKDGRTTIKPVSGIKKELIFRPSSLVFREYSVEEILGNAKRDSNSEAFGPIIKYWALQYMRPASINAVESRLEYNRGTDGVGNYDEFFPLGIAYFEDENLVKEISTILKVAKKQKNLTIKYVKDSETHVEISTEKPNL